MDEQTRMTPGGDRPRGLFERAADPQLDAEAAEFAAEVEATDRQLGRELDGRILRSIVREGVRRESDGWER